ncbi:MAG: hypothetical protein IKC87_06695 [Clostridia bacterium]|nr:hypothetical protein [Clostridia bacterium]
MDIRLTEGVKLILDRLYEQGYRADVVGGAVRDALIGRPSFDFDITTEATPDEVKSVFADCKIVDTGIKHGTVTLVLDGVGYEITTWRVDGDYHDSRHPDAVSFTRSLSEDLARRDFTVNAICYNERDGYTDIFGGVDDIRAKVIRAVGEPERRFREDALRIMRAVRFSSQLGFSIEEHTALAATKLRSLLLNVSDERIYVELKKLLSADGAHEVLSSYPEIILTVLPELDGLKLPDRELFISMDYKTRLLSLFLLNAKDARERFSSAMQRLKTDSAHRVYGESVLSHYKNADTGTRYGALKLLSSVGPEVALGVAALGVLVGEKTKLDLEIIEDAIASGIPYTLSELKVGGNDIAALGLRGPEIGKALLSLLDAVMSGECVNERDALLGLCQKDFH